MMKFVLTKVKEDGSDAKPFITDLEEISHFISNFTLYEQRTIKIEKIEK